MSFATTWKNFSTSGLDLPSTSPNYRRVYLINTMMLIGIVIFSFFAVFNILITGLYLIVAIDIVGLLLSLSNIWLMRVKKNVDLAATIVVMILFLTTLAFMYQENHRDYALIYAAFFPLFAIFLKGIKKGILFTVFYFALYFLMIASGMGSWQSVPFTHISFINIIAVSIGLVLLTFYYELSRKEAFDAIRNAHQKEIKQAHMLQITLDELNEYKNNLEEKVETTLKEKRAQEQMLIQQSKMAAMGEMIAAIAHQWKQPLATTSAIVSNIKLEMLLNHDDHPVYSQGLEDILKQVYFMSQTITDFSGFFKPSRLSEPFDLGNAIDDVVVLLGEQLKRHSITLEKSYPKEPLMVEGYRNEFLQVVLNIINNAKEAIGDQQAQGKLDSSKGEITIMVTIEEGVKTLTIADNGGGIPQDIIDKVFDPYFTTKPEDVGTGIGLHMAKMIIEDKMQGSISVVNENQGSKFIIKFKE